MQVNPIAAFSPTDYVFMLDNLQIPDYQGPVRLRSYLSANQSFDGNEAAKNLYRLMKKIAEGKSQIALMKDPEFHRVFEGQGSIDNTIKAMTVINQLQDEFKKEVSLAKYFQEPNFLQAMIDEKGKGKKLFGLDCIGFVGTYLVESGVLPFYPSLYPIDYTNFFQPIKSFNELKDDQPAVVMKTDGQHIQIIDSVVERHANTIRVALCQSSSGGPQVNHPTTIVSGGGDYLDIKKFRYAKQHPEETYGADWAADNAARDKGKERSYESFLRAEKFRLIPNTQKGYLEGAIFKIQGDGSTPNPVPGSIYIGVLKGQTGTGLRIRGRG